MAYQTGDIILDTHYNTFATDVNNVWGTGTGDTGYGETGTVLSTVSDGTVITATQWANMLSRISSSASHQGSSITAITNPSTSDPIEAYTALSGNISTIQTNRTTTASYGATSTNADAGKDNTTDWITSLTFTTTLTFAGGNEARWFFNAGGRVAISVAHTSGSNAKDTEWTNLVTKCGTYYIMANSGGQSGGTAINTVTDTNETAIGYYQIPNLSYQKMYERYSDGSPYTANYITYNAQMNADDATDGLGNNGTVMTLQVVLTDAAADQAYNSSTSTSILDNVTGQTTVTFSYDPPSATYLTSAAWGTPSWGVISATPVGTPLS